MSTVTLELKPDLANRIENLIQLFGSSEIMFDKFLEYHIKQLKREIVVMQSDLNEYEQKFKMPTSEFYEQFENGLLDDSKDFILWSGIYEMQMNCKQKLQKLL